MGAGASTAANTTPSSKSWVVSEVKDPSTPENHLSISSPLLLTLTQESLDLIPVDKADKTVLHYPYHQIKCWSSTPSYFTFQLGVEKVQTAIKFTTTEGTVIQKHLLETILEFMDQSKDGALQPADFKGFQETLFNSSKQLVGTWSEVADEFFETRPFRLTAAHAMDLLADVDLTDEFVSLDFCCMLHKYILNQDSFKLVIDSISDRQLKLNLASRLGISDASSGGGVTVKAPMDSDFKNKT